MKSYITPIKNTHERNNNKSTQNACFHSSRSTQILFPAKNTETYAQQYNPQKLPKKNQDEDISTNIVNCRIALVALVTSPTLSPSPSPKRYPLLHSPFLSGDLTEKSEVQSSQAMNTWWRSVAPVCSLASLSLSPSRLFNSRLLSYLSRDLTPASQRTRLTPPYLCSVFRERLEDLLGLISTRPFYAARI